MFPFIKREKRKGTRIPVDVVKNLSSKGMSEPEIVAVLRKQGYSPYEIERAISLALKSTVSGTGEQSFPSSKEIERFPSQQGFQQGRPSVPEFHTLPSPQPVEQFQQPTGMQPEQKQEKPPFPQLPQFPFPFGEKQRESPQEEIPKEFERGIPDLTLEEIIEGIVAEKWQSFEEHLERLRRKDDELHKQIMDLRKEIDKIKEDMRKAEESFIAKLEEQSEQVTSIGARIGSIEKIFKEFLPELTESMRVITEALEKSKHAR